MATWDAQANELFLSALELSHEDRPAFLDAACTGDAVLRGRVEALLDADGQARDFLARPAVAPIATAERPSSDRLGPYKLLQKIGEGGMGSVWMAEQTEPVRRTVAVKVIRGGTDSHVVARFEAERQALALMDHPNIAKVLDAGTTPEGRPYFVMELVKGVPITAFCDERRLSVPERLALFVQVCRAVQHAHLKGVIHRDLKPSNIMVALYDGRPVPKVIDFGVAKATGQRLTDKTLFTEFGTVIGTLEYMSPEQAELNQLDVDTRADVYSLGVLLYELLTGTTPLERNRLGSVPLLEVLRQVREGDTPRPSTRLSTANALPTVAAARGIDPGRLAGLLRGELDWIAMTALEKDRERRYESAAALAADVERYLRDDPVQACPPSVWYRVRKFTRRNRRGLIAAGAGALVLALALGAVAGVVGWAIRDAESRRAKAADEARTAATSELNKVDVLLAARKRTDAESAWERAKQFASEAEPDETLAARLAETRTRLDAAARDETFVDGYEALLLEIDPRTDELDAMMNCALKPDARRKRELLTGYGLGTDTDPAAAAALVRSRPDDVRRCLIAALYECAHSSGFDRPGDARVMRWFLQVLDAIDPDPWRIALRATFTGADPATIEKLVREVNPRQHPPAVLLLAFYQTYGVAPQGAIELLHRARAAHPGDVWLNSQLGLHLLARNEPGKAVPCLTAALALRPHNPSLLLYRAQSFRALGQLDAALADAVAAVEADPRHAIAHGFHSRVLQDRKDAAGAEAAARRALAIDPNSSFANLELGNALRLQSDAAGALVAYRAAVAAVPTSANAQASVGLALQDLGDTDGAIAAYRAAAAVDPKHARSRLNLGVALWTSKKDADGAVAALRDALTIDPAYGLARSHLVRVLLAARRHEAGLAEARKGIELEPQSATAYLDFGTALQKNGHPDEALEAFRRSVFLDPKVAMAQLFLGAALGLKKEYKAAAECFRQAAAVEPSNVAAWTSLGLVLLELNEVEEAIAAYRKAIAAAPKQPVCHSALASALARKGDKEGAAAAYREAARLNAKYPNAWSNAGVTYYQLGRWKDARDAWVEAVQAFPDDAQSHYRLGVVSTVGPDPELYDHRAAEESGRKLLGLRQTANGWTVIAWAEYRKGDWKAAVAAVQKALAPGVPANQLTPLRGYLLAVAHAKLGDAAEARKWYDKAAEAKGDPIPEADARARAEAAELLGITSPKK